MSIDRNAECDGKETPSVDDAARMCEGPSKQSCTDRCVEGKNGCSMEQSRQFSLNLAFSFLVQPVADLLVFNRHPRSIDTVSV